MKRTLFAAALLLASPAAPSAAQTAGGKPERPRDRREAELLEVERSRSEAIRRGDLETLGRIYADDFSGVAANGRVVNKSELFEVFKRTDPRLTFEVDDLGARVFEKTAVVTGRLTGRTPGGETASQSRFTHVYVRRHGRWQFVAGQSTNVARQ